MDQPVLRIQNVSKQYRLGVISGGTLQRDLQSWWALKRGKEDPNTRIGSKKYGKNERFYALQGVSAEFRAGETVGIIGKNGAGKSTLLKLLSRITAPTDGEIYIKGHISSMLEVGTGFHGELTGRENIYMNGAILGMTRAEIDAKMEQIIEFSECREFIDTPVKRYSSGMYVKLAFSVAAHLDSEIMIMDEVLAVGDMAFQRKCLDKMAQTAREEGRTVLYVSHNMNTIRRLCSRCLVLEQGKLIYDGDTERAIELYLNHTHAELDTVIETKDLTRPDRWPCHARIDRLEFPDRTENAYTVGETVTIRMDWESFREFQDVRLLVQLFDAEGLPVGSALSDTLAEQTHPDEQFHTCVRARFGGLVSGRYRMSVTLYCQLPNGNMRYLDMLEQVCMLEIRNDPHAFQLPWSNAHWGRIRFENITRE